MKIQALILTAVVILGTAAPAASAASTLGLGGHAAALALAKPGPLAPKSFVPYDPLRGQHAAIVHLGQTGTAATKALVESGRLDPAPHAAPRFDPWFYGPAAGPLAQLAWVFAQSLR